MITNVPIEEWYSYSYQPTMRWGGGLSPHKEINAMLVKGDENYKEWLQLFSFYTPDFLTIKVNQDPANPSLPNWSNGFFPGLDGVALYSIIAGLHPPVYCEIGSGNSTKFATMAQRLHSPTTKIISIDPAPRVEIELLGNQLIRLPLQQYTEALEQLEKGDILFLDGSHRVFQNSDVTVFFLEVLPRLAPGVIVHVHDIFWPWDYPTAFGPRMYSEQYMLGTMLLWAGEKIEILMPNSYVTGHKMISILDEVWKAPQLKGIEAGGSSFWFTKK
jgi:hypothetical protein